MVVPDQTLQSGHPQQGACMRLRETEPISFQYIPDLALMLPAQKQNLPAEGPEVTSPTVRGLSVWWHCWALPTLTFLSIVFFPDTNCSVYNYFINLFKVNKQLTLVIIRKLPGVKITLKLSKFRVLGVGNKIQVRKLEELIGFSKHFINGAASHLANRTGCCLQ